MTVYRVNSNTVGGDGSGDSWANGIATLSAAVSAGAGSNDQIWVHTGTTPHLENPASLITVNGPTAGSPLTIMGVDKDNSDVYTVATADTITTVSGVNDITMNGAFAVYGLWFFPNDDMFLSSDTNEPSYYKDCKFKTIGTAGEDIILASVSKMVDCTFDTGSASVISLGSKIVEFINPTFIGTRANGIINEGPSPSIVKIIGANLTALATELFDSTVYAGKYSVVGSVLHASSELYRTGTNFLRIITSGTDTASGNNQWRHGVYEGTQLATITLSESVYRDSAATYDGTNEYSFVFDSGTVNHLDAPLFSDWNSIYVASGDGQNVKVYVAHTAQLKDDDIWIEVEYFSETANTLKTVVSSRMALPTDTPAAMSNATGETWTGIAAYNGDTGQFCTLPANIDIEKSGMLRWRIGYAGVSAAGATIYVCPKIEII